MTSTKKVLKEASNIVKDFKKEVERVDGDYKVITAIDRLIVTQFEKFPINKLEDIRYNLNKIIKKKKEYKRINEKE